MLPSKLHIHNSSSLRNFKNKFLLEKLLKIAERDVGADAKDMNAETILREKEIEALFSSESSKSFVAPSAAAMAEMVQMENFLDNKEYQPLDYISDCKFFGFDPEHPRFPGMNLTFQFKSWQVTGMRRMITIFKNPIVRACLLADATGLGKTIEIIGFWIWIQIQRCQAVTLYEEELEDYNTEKLRYESWSTLSSSGNPYPEPDLPLPPPPPAKPLLLIVLPELIEQWAAEIDENYPDFQVLIYHGDERTSWFTNYKRVVSNSTKGKLTRNHPIFNGDEENSRVIVITSVVTMRSRHGPTALKNYRMHHLGYTRQEADDEINVSDPDWKYNLAGLFDHIAVDEAHILKNSDTMAHRTISWLEAKFTIMATATVLSNRLEDFHGYMSLIETGEAHCSDENLERWGVDINVNPYTLPDNHPASILRFTTDVIDKRITSQNKDLEFAGWCSI
ncbi:hypothetical protein EAE99_004946 [Botrytis elliptica]|nr:hypothetical protein EAE99_004946 [Botrytis elliptica]